MQKLENYTLQKFMDSFVTELKRENEDRERHGTHKLIIPFVISTLYQSFNSNPEKYKELIDDLKKWSDYGLVIEKSTNDYDGIIDVEISLIKYDEESEEEKDKDLKKGEKNCEDDQDNHTPIEGDDCYNVFGVSFS